MANVYQIITLKDWKINEMKINKYNNLNVKETMFKNIKLANYPKKLKK